MRAVLFVLIPLLMIGLGVVAALTLGSDEPAYRGGAAGSGAVVSGAKIATISTGEDVDLAAHAVPGGRTIFEYTADW